jgi:hypothetical protein
VQGGHAEGDIKASIEEANKVLLNSTVNNTCSIRGWNRFFGNTPIDYASRYMFESLYSWVSGALSPWFTDTLAPAWNGYFAADDRSAMDRRTALGYLATAFFATVLGLAVKSAFDWLHDIFLARRN